MRWKPEKLWDGEDAFIIGGGRSLLKFDWSLLVGERTVGCNDAYLHGPEVCDVCVFGDANWLKVHEDGLTEYVGKGGFVVTNATQLEASKLIWLHWMQRHHKGLHLDSLGWNKNTGAAAINLALLLGAKRVFLLGFDRYCHKKKPNWHEHIEELKPEIHDGMNYADTYMKKDLPKKFPGCQIINVTDHSDLDVWPKVPITGFFEERNSHGIVQDRAKAG